MATALDVSQYAGEISKAKFEDAKRADVSRVVVALNDLPLAKRQIANAQAAGLEVQVYIYLYFAYDVGVRVRGALEAIKDMGVKFVWIDCEDEQHSLDESQLRSKVLQAVSAAQSMGYQVGIYTGAWWWNKHMKSITSFKHLPLWDAYWDKDPDIDPPRYGGWAETTMSQHTADTYYAGIWCDINSYVVPTSTHIHRVDIELVIGDSIVVLSDGSYVKYEDGRHYYRRPVNLGDLGSGNIVVAVHD